MAQSAAPIVLYSIYTSATHAGNADGSTGVHMTAQVYHAVHLLCLYIVYTFNQHGKQAAILGTLDLHSKLLPLTDKIVFALQSSPALVWGTSFAR